MSDPQLEGDTASAPAGNLDPLAPDEPSRRPSRPWIGAAGAMSTALVAGALAVWTSQPGWITGAAFSAPLVLYAIKELLSRYQTKRFTKPVAWTVLAALAIALGLTALLIGTSSEPLTDCEFCLRS